MLAETGRAAVIHPTGTGKSFIGFKLCEDNFDKTIVWISPSEYIFKTQLENLKAAGGDLPTNVIFLTYSKLMIMSEDEMLKIKPDIIILDEFHRGGATAWGSALQMFLGLYTDVLILGLSATNIRYLDNQRDMAEELFDGNIASAVTLGEAVVRGILNPPKYVLSVFSYQKDLEKYERRVRNTGNKAVHDAAEKYLEALRRSLEKADGLDVIFDKHMTDRTGKYIVFCANKEHMDEMMRKSGEWFARVDKHPHIYSVYSDDPGASKSFADFKADEDSTHLRLLYCIDALNEGIHVKDVNGVILLRPTVSPIIYKQQIGRALSASKNKDAVIFDIVMNIENLYSIGALEEEMRVAMTYYRSFGDGENVVNEQFKVIDELRDCRELFEKLNDTLTASWDAMYSYAKAYYTEHGNLEVPRRYKTSDGYSLGSWIFTQRKVKNKEQYGVLDADRIARLDEIGMIWESVRDCSWAKYLNEAKKYFEAYGNLLVPVNTQQNGVPLGRWLANLRCYKKSGIKNRYLTSERIETLNSFGMVWDVPDYLWEQNYAAAMQYHRDYGNLSVPLKYITPTGIKLGAWLQKVRSDERCGRSTLCKEQKDALSSLGFTLTTSGEAAWQNGYEEAKKYFARNHNLNVPFSYESETGFKLGDWIANQRERYKSGRLRKERIERLCSIGMVWSKPDAWELRFAMAEKYFREHKNLKVPARYKVGEVDLNKWLNEQRQIYKGNRSGKSLTNEQISRLENIGMVWDKNDKKYSGDTKIAV